MGVSKLRLIFTKKKGKGFGLKGDQNQKKLHNKGFFPRIVFFDWGEIWIKKLGQFFQGGGAGCKSTKKNPTPQIFFW